MKKRIALLLAAMLCLAVSGCGRKKEEATEKSGKQAAGTVETKPSPEEIISAYAEKHGSELDEANDRGGGTMKLSFSAEGKNLVLTAQYLVDVAIDTNAIERTLENNGDTYRNAYEELIRETGVEDAKLIVRYLDVNGAVVLERVIDERFTFTGTDPVNTLEEFVNSDSFRDSIATYGNDQITVDAALEDGSTVVIIYTLQQVLPRENLDAMRESWAQLLGGDEMRASFENAFGMIRRYYSADDLRLKLRITDLTGETLFEQTLDFDS